MAFTWDKWEDMSVDSTISMTSARSSLCTKMGGSIVDLGLRKCPVRHEQEDLMSLDHL